MPGTTGSKETDMSYGALLKWTVKTCDPELGKNFDLKKDDVLEFTGIGDGGVTSIAVRHRPTEAPLDWGGNCFYDITNPALPTITGNHNASGGLDKFTLTIALGVAPKAIHGGNITWKNGGGTGGHGTWTAEEGG